MDWEWHEPVEKPHIYHGELHVWKAQLSSNGIAGDKYLGQEERLRLQRFRFEHDRRMFFFAHSLLRHLLGRYLEMAPGKIEFSYTSHGKPYLSQDPQRSRLEFNLSHSGEMVVIAVTRGIPVGVDVEHIRPIPDLDQVAGRFFSPGEQQALQSLSGDGKIEAFYRCWTRKEAVIKACGEGLSMPLDTFQVSLLPGEPARLLINPDHRPWLLVDLAPGPGYAGAAAAPVGSLNIRCFSADRLLH